MHVIPRQMAEVSYISWWTFFENLLKEPCGEGNKVRGGFMLGSILRQVARR